MAFIQWDFYSESLQIATSANIIIPQKSVQTSQKIPVLYLLHGLSDDHTIWQRRTAIERYVDQKNLVVIMPAVNRSFYTNTTSGTLYWDFISKELPHLCKRFFPISTKRADTFVAGSAIFNENDYKFVIDQMRSALKFK